MFRQLTRKIRHWFDDTGDTGNQRTSENAIDGASGPEWFSRGLIFRESGEIEAALACFKRAVEIQHDHVPALINAGELEEQLGRHEDAADSFALALAFEPDSVTGLLDLGRLARESGDHMRALPLLQRAAALVPNDPESCFELGRCYKRAGDTHRAVASYTRALELQPNHAGACINLGMIYLTQLGDPHRAQPLFERAIVTQPQSIAAQANLGLALHEQGRCDEALAHYARLIDAYPEVAEYRWNRGIALLSRGDFSSGWEDYEMRNQRGGKVAARHFPFPAWNGDSLAGHHLLVFGEQGVGDEIMFASCIPDVLRHTAGTVIECDHRLTALFQRSFPNAHIYGGRRDGARDWLKAFPQLDTQIAMASLPRYLRRQRSDFAQQGSYLTADPARVAYWKSRLKAAGMGPSAGISWRGGTMGTRRELRSLAIEQCLPLCTTAGWQFVCLQNGDCSAEIEHLRCQGADLQWWPETTENLDDLAALITALDLVISVDNTVVHLSGALGTPLWVMLACNPEWRYMWQGERMPWYPSAILFRQDKSGVWDGLVRQLRQRLESMAQCR